MNTFDEDVDSGNSRETQDDGAGFGKPPKKFQFTSTYQPGRNKAKETFKRKRDVREVMKELLKTQYFFTEHNERLKELLEKAFGKKKINRMTAVELMLLQQINKAILKGDTQAFNSILNQTYGMPKQIQEVTGKDGAPLERATVIHVQSVDNLPPIRENEEEIEEDEK